MHFGLMFANAGPLGLPEVFTRLATTAERVGFESLWMVEHVVIPVGYKSRYPYDPSGRIPAPDSLALPDPLLQIAYAAAITEKIRLATGILILPQRHPLYVAKEVATLDVLSHGRMILGIGVGWLAEEFEALGIPFEERAGRTAEAVRAIRSLWKPEPAPFEGKYFEWGPLESHPKPVQQPGVPVVVGGHTEMAARRAARYGDGFYPGVDPDRLKPLLAVLKDECAKLGRKPESIELTAGGGVLDLDMVRRFQDLGVSRLTIAPPAFDPDGLVQGLETFADKVIARV
jgi:probable F420-dependent oxidoreductase